MTDGKLGERVDEEKRENATTLRLRGCLSADDGYKLDHYKKKQR